MGKTGERIAVTLMMCCVFTFVWTKNVIAKWTSAEKDGALCAIASEQGGDGDDGDGNDPSPACGCIC